MCCFLGLAAWLAGALKRNWRLLGSWWCVALSEVERRTTLWESYGLNWGLDRGVEGLRGFIRSGREVKPSCVPECLIFSQCIPFLRPHMRERLRVRFHLSTFGPRLSAAQSQVPQAHLPGLLYLFLLLFVAVNSAAQSLLFLWWLFVFCTSLHFNFAALGCSAQCGSNSKPGSSRGSGGGRGSVGLRRPRQWCLLKCDLFNDFPQPLYKFPIWSYIRRCSGFSIISVSLLVFGNGSWN